MISCSRFRATIYSSNTWYWEPASPSRSSGSAHLFPGSRFKAEISGWDGFRAFLFFFGKMFHLAHSPRRPTILKNPGIKDFLMTLDWRSALCNTRYIATVTTFIREPRRGSAACFYSNLLQWIKRLIFLRTRLSYFTVHDKDDGGWLHSSSKPPLLPDSIAIRAEYCIGRNKSGTDDRSGIYINDR